MQFAAAEPFLDRTRLRLRLPCRRPHFPNRKVRFARHSAVAKAS